MQPEDLIGFMNHLMINTMNCYHIIFERIYSLFGKGASLNPSHEELDGAVISTLVFCFLLFINTLTVLLIIDMLFDYSVELKPVYGLIWMVILIIINFLYFLSGKRYVKIKSGLTDRSKQKRNRDSIIVRVYSFFSIVIFFILL